jgi:hypothetical protein
MGHRLMEACKDMERRRRRIREGQKGTSLIDREIYALIIGV